MIFIAPRILASAALGVLLLCCFFFAHESFAQDAAPGQQSPGNEQALVEQHASPRIEFSSVEFDFGKVLSGELVRHNFVFTNSGNGLLLINDVRSTCGCTSATNSSKRVEPGQAGIIAVELRTGNLNGSVSKEVSVSSNATNLPVAKLQLRGTVWRPIEVSPPTAAFTSASDLSSNTSKVLRIINRQEKPLIVSAPESNQRAISAQLKTNTSGQEYQLIVKLVPPLGSGNTFGEVTLKTSMTQMPVLTVPVWAVPQVRSNQ